MPGLGSSLGELRLELDLAEVPVCVRDVEYEESDSDTCLTP